MGQAASDRALTTIPESQVRCTSRVRHRKYENKVPTAVGAHYERAQGPLSPVRLKLTPTPVLKPRHNRKIDKRCMQIQLIWSAATFCSVTSAKKCGFSQPIPRNRKCKSPLEPQKRKIYAIRWLQIEEDEKYLGTVNHEKNIKNRYRNSGCSFVTLYSDHQKMVRPCLAP